MGGLFRTPSVKQCLSFPNQVYIYIWTRKTEIDIK
uniref:Uncharacterized protein n=1 Tax=Rhizophora mucronata TaxID=61149 RepID=A0A2P2KZ24_RHIMU